MDKPRRGKVMPVTAKTITLRTADVLMNDDSVSETEFEPAAMRDVVRAMRKPQIQSFFAGFTADELYGFHIVISDLINQSTGPLLTSKDAEIERLRERVAELERQTRADSNSG